MNAQYRKTDLAKIHLAKKELGMDDETYRAMLNNVAGVTSAKDLDVKGRMDVLSHMRSCGIKFKKSKAGSYPGKPHNMDEQRGKIEALLADMKLEWAYADALAKRMFKVERVAWVKKGEQLKALITALSNEQTKRNLYQSVIEMLDELKMNESDIDDLMKSEDLNWRRSIRHLRAINNHLNNLLQGD